MTNRQRYEDQYLLSSDRNRADSTVGNAAQWDEAVSHQLSNLERSATRLGGPAGNSLGIMKCAQR